MKSLATRRPCVFALLFPATVLLVGGLTGCKKESVVDKTKKVNDELRETQKARKREEIGKEPRRLKAMNWRVVSIASSFASPGRKRIDALGEEFGWQVNLYEETGDKDYDRVELDKDRDGKMDETWRYVNGRWEKFGGRLFWSGTKWVQAGSGKVDLPQVSTQTAGGTALHKAAIEMLRHKAVNYEVADFLVGHGPRIALFDDDWDARWDRAELDTDRDGTLDEKWHRKGETLTRQVLGDKTTFVFKNDRWVQTSP